MTPEQSSAPTPHTSSHPEVRANLEAGVPQVQRQSVWNTLKKPGWLKTEVLAGIVVALALIPEAIAFSIIAGVDPKVGLYSSAIMAIAISFIGGRPAMITAATAATALVIAPVVASHGLEYLLATVILAGLIQILLGVLGAAKLMRFIPRSVMTGFVNALAILVFIAQLPDLISVPWMVYLLVVIGLVIIFVFPRITTAVPAPLVSIVVITVIALALKMQIPAVGDKGELPDALPVFLIPTVPLTWDTLTVIAGPAFAMAVVGLLESLLTAKLVDDITDTRSDKTRESLGQGGANILSGFFGGMGGCAVVGQTMMNVKASGARTRLSTFIAGVGVLTLSVVLGDLVSMIPMAALVAVMIYVAYATFEWHSIRPATLKALPWSENIVMIVTVVGTVLTSNLAIGVGLGVLCAMVLFARRVAHFVTVERRVEEPEDHDTPSTVTYTVDGELFWASSNDLYTQFSYLEDPAHVIIDMHGSHLWDVSTVASLDAITEKYERYGKTVDIVGLNEASKRMRERLRGKLN